MRASLVFYEVPLWISRTARGSLEIAYDIARDCVDVNGLGLVKFHLRGSAWDT